MRYLLYYKLESDFITEQQECGGDGTNVVSVVDGVAWSNNSEKVFYRKKIEAGEIEEYTVTVHYTNRAGDAIEPDDVITVNTYVGKAAKAFISPKSIVGYSSIQEPFTMLVSGDSEYTFMYKKNDMEKTYFTFNIISSGTINWYTSYSESAKTISYSIDNGKTWSEITSTSYQGTSINVTAGDKVMFKGDNDSYGAYISSYNTYYHTFNRSTAKFSVEGNIMSLIDSTGFTTATTLESSYTFYNLFYGCTGLTSAENLVLPATTLTSYCYDGMFDGCTSLTTAPELPATTLSYSCYYNMFSRCSSLTTAPALPATTLASYCYQYMFYNCRSLTTVQSSIGTSATTMAASACSRMFQGCTSLTTAPELPAITLANGCYSYMFANCTNLTIPPSSIGTSATTMAASACVSMFSDCISLATAPALPATRMMGYCYYCMFYKCTSLTKAPELPATSLGFYCYSSMFRGCTNLKIPPRLQSTILGSAGCYASMFADCTSLTTAPELPATSLTKYCYNNMFAGCISLTSAPILPATTLANYCYYGMFSGCTNLNYIKCLGSFNTTYTTTYTTDWVNGVSCSGTFVKNPNMTGWKESTSGVPFGWTVIDDGETFYTNKNYVGFSLSGGNKTVKVTSISNHRPWTASTSESWIHISPMTGGVGETIVTITCDSASGDRQGIITFNGGETLIDEKVITISQIDAVNSYLTLNILSSGTIPWVAVSTSSRRTIDYSKDGGSTWTTITSNSGYSAPLISVSTGDKVLFRGNNMSYGDSFYYSTFSGSTAKFSVEGNIMSLIDSTGFTTATTLQSGGTFRNLFYNCTGLTSAENLVLPATTLLDSCYYQMFYNCAGLTTAPELPATTLASSCYTCMFQGCTSLTTAPELPATTLAQSCYYYMFYGCTSLTTAPELPASDLANNCYRNMFVNCVNLIKAPSSIGTSATTIVASSCTSMFSGCKSLTTAPELPATTLTERCYSNMFYGCTSLTTAPSILPATTLANSCYTEMFYNCISLATAPELPATTLAQSCYYGMFYRCSSLTTAPELPATTLANSCYTEMFYYCTSLTTVSALPATTLANNCYRSMFQGCSSLSTAPSILPATTLADTCYRYMFMGCTSLTTAPELPATTLTDYCYYSMFQNCRSLNYIKCLATDISASNCTNYWVDDVQTNSGTFVKNPNMSNWTTGNNGIPTNWTVQDAS